MPPKGGIIFCRLTRGYPIRLSPHCYLHPRLYPFLPSFHFTVTLLNINRCLRLILSCRINSVISLFVCVVQISASDMSLMIRGEPLGKSRELSADGISGNRYLRSGGVRWREPQGMAGIVRVADACNWLRCHNCP